MAAATPASAGAATQLGQTFTPEWPCIDNVNFLQSVSPGSSYVAPHDGVISNWSFQSPSSGSDLLKLKVGRPAGGGQFTTVGSSGALMDPPPGQLSTYPAQIPVFAGDIIGFYWNQGNTAPCAHRTGDRTFHNRNHDGDVPPGTTSTFSEETGFQLDIAASLEPDCDKDGLGDETQDVTTSPCATCAGQRANIIGTNGNDTRSGTPGADVMVGLGGRDKLSGLAGNDVICGGAGKDTLNGGKGKDKLRGEGGKDKLNGGPGKDKLNGGPGKDKQVQ